MLLGWLENLWIAGTGSLEVWIHPKMKLHGSPKNADESPRAALCFVWLSSAREVLPRIHFWTF
jgi:hypothetical protein